MTDELIVVEEVSDVINLENGVVLKTKSLPPMGANLILQKYKEPKPPVIKHKNKEIVNFDDPGYLADKQNYEERLTAAMTKFVLAYGVEIVSIPDDFPNIKDELWLDELVEVYGEVIERPKTPAGRRLMWLTNIALTDPESYSKLLNAVQGTGNVREVDVAEALDSFPDDEGHAGHSDAEAEAE